MDYHRRAPSVAQIEELVDWLSTVHAQKELFATNRLGSVFAPARSYADVASGLLAVSIPKTDRNYILWFRSEVATTVVWARHPGKRLQLEGGVVRLHPRLSFEFWREVVDGVAVPWKKAEIDAVTAWYPQPAECDKDEDADAADGARPAARLPAVHAGTWDIRGRPSRAVGHIGARSR